MLIRGDNLAVLTSLARLKEAGGLRNPDGSRGARLAYIDPPFSTRLSFKDRHDRRAFDDKITGADFIGFLRSRITLIRELLTEDGAMYVHLDWKMAHYIKIVMDEVFGEDNFLNDIIWRYGGRGAKAVSAQFSRDHDIILWYSKGVRHVFNRQYTVRRVKKGTPGFRMDSSGRWYKTSPRGDYTDDSIAALMKDGRIHTTKNGNIRIKYFLKEDGGYLLEEKPVGDVWDDIPDAMHMPVCEKTGYPTQKPEALLRRIVAASTNPGDIVLDAFAGAGTTLVAAEKLGRRWVGIDSGALSIATVQKRLLSINSTKDPADPQKKFSAKLRPFIFYKAHTP